MKIADQVRNLERKVRELEAENKLLKERLRSGWKDIKITPNREKIKKFLAKNPDATLKQIKEGCGLSTTSLVFYHLQQIKLEEIRKEEPI